MTTRIIRVFPSRTPLTPRDRAAYIGHPYDPPLFAEADEVHVSATFKWDLPFAEKLARLWKSVAPVKIGGPATGEAGGDFVPGLYLAEGAVITSRGCPNRCLNCSVWKREGLSVRPLRIHDGWNVLDDNLLACPDAHVRAVFEMLNRQVGHRVMFSGGLEAARLKDWHVCELSALAPESMFFAYDRPQELEPLRRAGDLLRLPGLGLTMDGKRMSNRVRCYVLVGHDDDTPEKAQDRCVQAVEAGFWPMAMYFIPEEGYEGRPPSRRDAPAEWRKFLAQWVRIARVKRAYTAATGKPHP